jgi:hypothetical protein
MKRVISFRDGRIVEDRLNEIEAVEATESDETQS